MKANTLALLTATALFATPAFAQEYATAATQPADSTPKAAAAEKKADSTESEKAIALGVFSKTVKGIRPYDQRGVNVFEMAKPASEPWTGPKMDIGAAFTQPFQSLKHENSAAPRLVGGQDKNKLITLGAGVPLASANMYFNAQLAPGVLVSVESYMASRGHTEFNVKGGYLQIDASPLDIAPLTRLMSFTTVKVGMFENNFGDAHFRRSDGGQAIYNPFVGNYIVDPFTTEAGAEIYMRRGPWLAMGAVTSGQMKGQVDVPERRGWARYGKVGFDQQFTSDFRFRLTGSLYKADRSTNQTIYSGDRPGSRYFDVLVDSVGRDRWSGTIQPGFRSAVQAVQVNPFVKFRGLEVFGTIDRGKGKAATEPEYRTLSQNAADVVYRFGRSEKVYVGGRWNTARMELQGIANEVGADRMAAAAGWYISPLVLLKAEYVTQKYVDFPTTDRRSGGKFNGVIMEGVVAF